ncbi:MAG: hypothetical protein M1831_003837 [Alyxoria varia]|nr:MAG: hypothetical protein M1831_003837 [Alyxoria varia]
MKLNTILFFAFTSSVLALPKKGGGGGGGKQENPKQATGTQAAASGAAGGLQEYLEEKIGDGKGSKCCDSQVKGECMHVEAKDDHPHPFDLCYTEGDQEFTAKDADVAKCLTNLHYVQPDKCISVKGSSCDNGYIESGGRLQNALLLVVGAHDGPITADQSLQYQSGIDALIGRKIVTSTHEPWDTLEVCPSITAKNKEDDDNDLVMNFRYIGEDEC